LSCQARKLMKQLSGQAIAVSLCHSYQLDLTVTLQRIGHRMLMDVNRGYHSQRASKYCFYSLHKTGRRQFHATNLVDDHYTTLIPRKPRCLLQSH
jgi:hypothetical protein